MNETPDFFTEKQGILLVNPEPFTQNTGNGQNERFLVSTNLPVPALAELEYPAGRPTLPGEPKTSEARDGAISPGRKPESRGGQTNLSGGVESSADHRESTESVSRRHAGSDKLTSEPEGAWPKPSASEGRVSPAQLFTNQKEGDADETRTTRPIAVHNEYAPARRNSAPYSDRVREKTRGIAANGSTVGRGTERHLASPGKPNFQGDTYVAALDESRLCGQLKRVRDLMKDSKWRSLSEIAEATDDPQASVSARLRDLRKPAFGLWTVDRRRRSPSQFEYQLRGKGL